MRYQCEYELRVRLIGLREAYLFHAGAREKCKEILAGATRGASALYRARGGYRYCALMSP